MLEKGERAKYIPTIDLRKGYWRILLEKTSIPNSAFVSYQGLFELAVMPFGMKTAPATFQRMEGLDFADAYLDDVEVDTQISFSRHLVNVRLQ